MLFPLIGALLFSAPTFELTILHTNDLHGHLVPFPYTESGRGTRENPSAGGAARRATLIRNLRASTHRPTILVDGGDTFTRGPLTNAYEGIPDIEAMNAAGYEVAELGNNEFKAKDGSDRTDAEGAKSALLRAVRRSRFSWICANVRDENGSGLPGVHPFVVRQWKGVRVGFLGLVTPRCMTYPQTKGWRFEDPIEAARSWVPRARQECDVLIALTHIGTDSDKILASRVAGIDAIVGADSHTFLYRPLAIANPLGKTVPIVQDGELGVNVGRLDLWFVKDAAGKWSLKRSEGRLIPVESSTPEDPAVRAALRPYLEPFESVAGTVSMGPAPRERTEATLHTFADAMRTVAKVPIAIVREDSVQAAFPNPKVRKLDVFAVDPFRNEVVVGRIDPKKLTALSRSKGCVVVGSIPATDDACEVAAMDYTAEALGLSNISSTRIDVRDAVLRYLRDRRDPRKP